MRKLHALILVVAVRGRLCAIPLKLSATSPPAIECFSPSKPHRGIFRHGRHRRRRGQGLCPPVAQGHRSRPDRERRNARRRQPQFQAKIRAEFSARGDRAAHAGRVTNPPNLTGLAWSRRRKPPAPPRCPPSRARPGSNRKWPSYARCLEGAPPSHEQDRPEGRASPILRGASSPRIGDGREPRPRAG